MDQHQPGSESPRANDSVPLPTHRLEDVKVGNHGVQLLVSTKDHLYDAKGVEAGENSWQIIGSWEESSVHELAKILGQRENLPSTQDTSGATRFGATYGSGRTISVNSDDGRKTVRRTGPE